MNGTYENIDCMELMANLKDKEIDLAIVDPPYGIGAGKSARLVTDKGLKAKSWDDKPINPKYFSELFRVSKNQIIWGGNYYSLPPTKHCVVWDKKQPEKLSFGMFDFAWTSFEFSNKIFYHPVVDGSIKIHPTQKPVKLYEWLLTNYAKPNDLILDTHCGSASSLIACENLGFKYIASELDKDYYSQSLQRLQTHLSQGKLFQRVGGTEIKISQQELLT